MSAEQEKESSENKPQDYEVKIVPEGTFAGHIDKPELVIKGEVVPEDTGDQGGGQKLSGLCLRREFRGTFLAWFASIRSV